MVFINLDEKMKKNKIENKNNINNNINININGNIYNRKNLKNIFGPKQRYIQHYPTTDKNKDKIIGIVRTKIKKNYEHNSNYVINDDYNYKINLKINILSKL